MLNYLSATVIYPVTQAPIQNGVLALQADGTIDAIFTAEEAQALGIENVQHLEGALIPGLINTHCHLELSHLYGKIAEHTGLQGFVQQVMQHRNTADNVIIAAMEKADEELYRNGVVAVGDISNLGISAAVKQKSKLYYHTFIEVLGFDPSVAETVMKRARGLKEAFYPLNASIVPHAPYSVSPELFAVLKAYSECQENLLSMHNQETADENLFFEQKMGSFLDLYKKLGLDISFFKASGKSSLQTTLPALPKVKALLVHNTMTSAADLEFAQRTHQDLYWCACPNANLYIESRLPDIALWRDAALKITLGTDSLASNHQLSILAEMMALQGGAALQTETLAFDELLQWATLNGAEFLGIAARFGSFDPGKNPGMNLVKGLGNGKISAATRIKRIDTW